MKLNSVQSLDSGPWRECKNARPGITGPEETQARGKPPEPTTKLQAKGKSAALWQKVPGSFRSREQVAAEGILENMGRIGEEMQTEGAGDRSSHQR